MSLVDAPPGLAFAGRAAGELVARPASLRLASRGLLVVVVVSVIAIARTTRRFQIGREALLVAPLVAIAVALVCFAVRRARLRVDGAGVRWGWSTFGFRVIKDGLAGATVYEDAIAFRRPTGSPWYLARYDFADFDRLPSVLRSAGIPFDRAARRAPLRARLQTYGVALDVLIVLDVIFAVLTLVIALGA